jgi:hypothetical protein
MNYMKNLSAAEFLVSIEVRDKLIDQIIIVSLISQPIKPEK